MAFDSFLKIDGIEGETADEAHKGEIEVLSWSWGETQTGSVDGGGGGGTGKVAFQDFHFVSRLQKSSPKLFLACASGQHIKSAILSVRKAGNRSADYYKVQFSDLIVSSFQQGGSSDGAESVPMEQISMNYSKIEMEYRPQDAKGVLGEPIRASWDIKENKGG